MALLGEVMLVAVAIALVRSRREAVLVAALGLFVLRHGSCSEPVVLSDSTCALP